MQNVMQGRKGRLASRLIRSPRLLMLAEVQAAADAEAFVVLTNGVSTVGAMEEVSSEVDATGEDAVTGSHEARAQAFALPAWGLDANLVGTSERERPKNELDPATRAQDADAVVPRGTAVRVDRMRSSPCGRDMQSQGNHGHERATSSEESHASHVRDPSGDDPRCREGESRTSCMVLRTPSLGRLPAHPLCKADEYPYRRAGQLPIAAA